MNLRIIKLTGPASMNSALKFLYETSSKILPLYNVPLQYFGTVLTGTENAIHVLVLFHQLHSFSLVLNKYIGSVRKLLAINSIAKISTSRLRHSGAA